MRALILAIPALAFTTGCMMEREYNDPFEAFAEGREGGDSDMQIRSGRVSGDIGSVRDFDAEATDSYGYSDGSYSSVTVTAYDARNRMGMLIVDLEGADIRSARAGTYQFSALSSSSVDGATPYITGCSESSGDFYDAPAEEGTVTISDTPEGRQIDVEAELPVDDGFSTTQATGTFVLLR